MSNFGLQIKNGGGFFFFISRENYKSYFVVFFYPEEQTDGEAWNAIAGSETPRYWQILIISPAKFKYCMQKY